MNRLESESVAALIVPHDFIGLQTNYLTLDLRLFAVSLISEELLLQLWIKENSD